MGIQNRDYMRRPADGDSGEGHPADSGAEAWLAGFLRRNPRFFVWVGVGIGLLVGITLLVAMFSR
jgi:hypothetical protein